MGRAAGGRSPGLTPRLMTRMPAPAAASCSTSVRCFAARRFADLVAPARRSLRALNLQPAREAVLRRLQHLELS